MRNKLLAVTALLAVVLAVIALQMRGNDRVADLESRSLLSEEQLEMLGQLDRIVLTRTSGSVELISDENSWGVASHDQFPAERERLAALLHAIRGGRITEDKTANPEHHARLGLDPQIADSEALQVALEAGDDRLQLIYGNQVGSGQLVRFADQDQVWLINRPLNASVISNDWLALEVIAIPMGQAANARWTHADGEVLELTKEAEGDYNFRLTGLEDVQQGGNERWINSMVLALINLTAQDVTLRSTLPLAEPALRQPTLRQPMLRMQVTTWAGAELEASLHDLEGRYWLTIDRFDQGENGDLQVNADGRWAYQVGVGQVESLNKRRSDVVRSTQ